MSLRTALRTSSNRAAVRLLQDVGIAEDRRIREGDGRRRRAERAVAGARLWRGDAQSMTAAYAAFANQGHACRSRC